MYLYLLCYFYLLCIYASLFPYDDVSGHGSYLKDTLFLKN
jgi:hypothetical protein